MKSARRRACPACPAPPATYRERRMPTSELDFQLREVADFEVSADGRTVETLLVPWMRPTDVDEFIRGQVVTYREQFAPGSFARAEASPSRVTLAWGHSNDFPNALGKGRKFVAADEGEIGIFQLVDETADRARELMADMGVSVSFRSLAPAHGLERAGELVTRKAVHLQHLAIVPNPAYPDARVVAVREQNEAERGRREAQRASDDAMAQALALAQQWRELSPAEMSWLRERVPV